MNYCAKCNATGYIETEIPLEQCLEALKKLTEYPITLADVALGLDAIEAAEEFFK